jgi:hypothetical protein
MGVRTRINKAIAVGSQVETEVPVPGATNAVGHYGGAGTGPPTLAATQ